MLTPDHIEGFTKKMEGAGKNRVTCWATDVYFGQRCTGPPIAQLVERRTVEVKFAVILRSLVQIRLGGVKIFFVSFFS